MICCVGEGRFSPWTNSSTPGCGHLSIDCNPKFKSTCCQGILAKPHVLRSFPGREKSPPLNIPYSFPSPKRPLQITAAQLPEPSARTGPVPSPPAPISKAAFSPTCCVQPSAVLRSQSQSRLLEAFENVVHRESWPVSHPCHHQQLYHGGTNVRGRWILAPPWLWVWGKC